MRLLLLSLLLCSGAVSAKSSSEHLAEARRLLKAGAQRKGLLILNRLMRNTADPKHEEAYLLYFETVLLSKGHRDAKELKKLEGAATQQDPGFFKAQLASLLSKAYCRDSQFKKAVSVLEPLASDSKYPFQQVKALIGLGAAYADWKKTSEAKRCLSQALAVLSRLSASQRKEADELGIGVGAIKGLLRKLNAPKENPNQDLAKRYEAAVKNYNAGKYATADKTFSDITQNHSDSKYAIGSRFYRAAILYQKADYVRASQQLAAFLNEHPTGLFAGRAHCMCGDIAMEHDFDFKKAEADYLSALKYLKETESDASVYFRLGLLMHSKKRFEEAVTYYQKEIALSPRKTDDNNLPNHTRFLVTMCQEKKSPLILEKKLGRQNDVVRNMLFIGSAYLESRKFKEAMRLFKLVQTKPYVAKATYEQKAYAILEEGECHRMQMQSATATERFSSVVKSFPKSGSAPIALFELARINLGSGEIAKGEDCLRRIISKYPTSPYKLTAYYNLAFSYYCREAHDDALKLYAVIKQKYPKSWEAEKSEFMINIIQGSNKK